MTPNLLFWRFCRKLLCDKPVTAAHRNSSYTKVSRRNEMIDFLRQAKVTC
jgi:hypothetical protein